LESVLENVRGKLLKGTAWVSAAGIVVNFLGFISTIVLAHFLTPADFGLAAFAMTIMGVLSAVTDLSLSSALVQHKNPTVDHMNTAWTLGLARSLIIAAILCAAAYPVSRGVHDPRLPVMLVLAIPMVLLGLSNPRAIMFTRDLIFWQQFLLTVGQRLTTFVVALTIAIIYQSYWAIIWAFVIGQAVNLLISYIILPYLPRLGVKHAKELFHFSFWLTVSQSTNILNWNFDQLVVGAVLGKTPLGFLSVGNNIAFMPTRELTRPITTPLFPAFSRLRDDPERLAATYQKAQGLLTAAVLPAGFGLALIADPLVRLCMGERWHPVVLIIQVLASVFAVQTLGSLSQPLAMAAGTTRLLFIRELQDLVIRLPSIIVGLLLDGLTGVVYARALTGIILVLFHMQVVKRVTGLTFVAQFAANIRSLASICVMVAVVLPLSHVVERFGVGKIDLLLEIAILIVLGAVAYLGSHAVMWIFSGKPEGPEREALKLFTSGINRLRPKITSSP
jgi:PST family polysaccharide transporter